MLSTKTDMLFNARFGKLILAALLLVPVAPAGAWDEVCMRLPLGKAWLSGRLALVHEFKANDDDQVPEKVLGSDFFVKPGVGDWRDVKDRFNELDVLIPESFQRVAEARSRQFPPEDLAGSSKWGRGVKEATAARDALIDERSRLMRRVPAAWHRIRNLLNTNSSLSPAVATTSGTILAGQTKCLSLRDIPLGAPFYVAFRATGQPTYIVCDTHPTNPHQWSVSQNRPYSKLEYIAWGHLWDNDKHYCRFEKEY